MKRVKIVFATLLLALSVMCMTVSGITASAISAKLNVTDRALWTGELATTGEELGLSVKDDGTVEFSESSVEKFKGMTNKEQKTVIKNFMRELSASTMSVDGTAAITEALCSAEGIDMNTLLLPYVFDETKGDILGASKAVTPIIPVISFLFGLGAIIILMLVFVSTIIDITVMSSSLIQGKVLENADGNKKPIWLSAAAYASIKNQAEGTDGNSKGSKYKSPYVTYIFGRIQDYIAVAAALIFLVLGGFGSFMGSFFQLLSGFGS